MNINHEASSTFAPPHPVRYASASLLRRLTVAILFVFVYLTNNGNASVDFHFLSSALTSLSNNSNGESYSNKNQTRRNELLQHQRLELLSLLPLDSVNRVAFVTFSYVKHNDTKKLFEFLLPAVDTWAAPTTTSSTSSNINTSAAAVAVPSLYVVFSETSRDPFEKICIRGEGVVPMKDYSTTVQTLCSRIVPIFVDCPEGKFGASPCCKQQKGLLELYQNTSYPLYDWYAFLDDDTYLRKEYIVEYMAQVFHHPEFPMATVSYSQNKQQVGYGNLTCGVVDEPDFMYPWGQPIFYSRGAMELMAPGYRAGSLMKQCAAFEVTHDVGNQILNWMYSLPMAKLPPLQALPYLREDQIGSHWVGREDMRLAFFNETKLARMPNRKTGKYPKIKARPVGDFSFYKIHERWMQDKLKPPEIYELPTVKFKEKLWYYNVTGFRDSRTYAQYGNPGTWGEGVWHTMKSSDCTDVVV